jgi:hypothetical protein
MQTEDILLQGCMLSYFSDRGLSSSAINMAVKVAILKDLLLQVCPGKIVAAIFLKVI